jgi:putative ABC transport system ATP-binding protein
MPKTQNELSLETMNNAPALEIENLTVTFAFQPVLRGFSLELAKGEAVVLSGDSGSGKSTILKCLLGFAVPAEGTIRIQGQTLAPGTVWPTRRKMAYVPQEPDLGRGKVSAVLDRPFAYRANQGLKKDPRKISEMFEALFLSQEILAKEITSLSGGEKQRIALVSALLLQRPILLLDEASSALDADAKTAFFDLLKSQEGITILAAAHDANWDRFAGRTIRLPGRKEKAQ